MDNIDGIIKTLDETLKKVSEQNLIIGSSVKCMTQCIDAFKENSSSIMNLNNKLIERLTKAEGNINIMLKDNENIKKDINETKSDYKEMQKTLSNHGSTLNVILEKVSDIKNNSVDQGKKIDRLEKENVEIKNTPAKKTYETVTKVVFEIIKCVAIAGVTYILAKTGLK